MYDPVLIRDHDQRWNVYLSGIDPFAICGVIVFVPAQQALICHRQGEGGAIIQPVLKGDETLGFGLVILLGKAHEFMLRAERVEQGKQALDQVDGKIAQGLAARPPKAVKSGAAQGCGLVASCMKIPWCCQQGEAGDFGVFAFERGSKGNIPTHAVAYQMHLLLQLI